MLPPPTSRALLLAAAALAGASVASGQVETPGCLEDFLLARMEQAKMPGMAASIVKDGEVVWAEGFGWANVGLGVPATADTPFFLASISKTVTGVALMQQRDTGAFDLADDINDHLDFPVELPSHPGVPITFRQLLTHTSGIRDNWPWMNPLYVPGDSPLALADYLPAYLSPGGEHYFPDQNYYTWAPGSTYAYANQGFALVGLLVEEISGQPFDAYCEEHVFEPLGMDDTGFRFSDFDPDTLAMPYDWDSGAEEYVPFGHYGYPDYPAGTLRSSVNDLSKFLLAIQEDGTYGGVEILDAASTAEMKAVPFPVVAPTQGLAFYYIDLFGETALGHDGGDPGVLTDMYYRPDDGIGVILLTNGEANFTDYYVIYSVLFDFAESESSEVSRVGTPPNPDVFEPGVTSGPVVGTTWDPVVEHGGFVPDALSDFVVVSGASANLDLGAPGTLLCDPGSPLLITATSAPGVPFGLPVPDDCDLIGLAVSAQAGSVDAAGAPHLTNALDVVIGAH